MTLNIDLEDVPFAILEAVKARILRNRGLLDLYNQQNPQPSLRPGPQFVKQGGSRRGWRLQKQAAMALGDGRALIISWQGTQLSLNSANASVLFVSNEELKPSSLQGFSGIPAVETFDNSPPTAFDQFGFGSYEVRLRSRTANYTLEAWGEVAFGGPSDLNTSSQLLLSLGSEGVTRHLLTVVNYPGGVSTNPFLGGQPGFSLPSGVYCTFSVNNGAPDNLSRVRVNVSSNPIHLCLQRISNRVHFYVNGLLVGSFLDGAIYQVVDMLSFASTTYLTGVYNQGPPAKLGQARFTPDRARYPRTGFTPNSLPFQL